MQLRALAEASTGSAAQQRPRLLALARLKAASAAQLAAWPPSQFDALDGTAAACFTSAMLASIPLPAMPVLRNTLLAGLSPDRIAAFSALQLAQLLADQIGTLTVRQLAALSRSQLAALRGEQLTGSSTARRLLLWQEDGSTVGAGLTAEVRYQSFQAPAPALFTSPRVRMRMWRDVPTSYHSGYGPVGTSMRCWRGVKQSAWVQGVQTLGFAAGAVVKGTDLVSLSPAAAHALHPTALACLLEAPDVAVPPEFLEVLSAEQAGDIPVDTLPTLTVEQMQQLLSAHANILPLRLAQPLEVLLAFRAACSDPAGCVSAAAVAAVPSHYHHLVAQCLPADLSATLPHEAGRLSGHFLVHLSEAQLLSFSKEHVQVRGLLFEVMVHQTACLPRCTNLLLSRSATVLPSLMTVPACVVGACYLQAQSLLLCAQAMSKEALAALSVSQLLVLTDMEATTPTQALAWAAGQDILDEEPRQMGELLPEGESRNSTWASSCVVRCSENITLGDAEAALDSSGLLRACSSLPESPSAAAGPTLEEGVARVWKDLAFISVVRCMSRPEVYAIVTTCWSSDLAG